MAIEIEAVAGGIIAAYRLNPIDIAHNGAIRIFRVVMGIPFLSITVH
jgi:hypothetical protein